MTISLGNDNINKIYLGGAEVSKIYLGDICIKDCNTPSPEPAQPWMAEKYMNGELLAEFEVTSPWQITDGDTIIADFTNFSADGLTASYTFYKDATTALNANAMYNGASPEYDNIDGYNWKFSVPEPYKIKVEQTAVVEKNYWTINGVRKGSITIYSDEKFIGDSYSDPMSIYAIPSLPELGAPLSGTTMGGKKFTLNVGETISNSTSEVNTNLKYVNKNTLQINYNY